MPSADQSCEAVARSYFALSNAGDLDQISSLFLSDATYGSHALGVFYGIDDIMMMMSGFFAEYHSLHWQIDSLVCETQHIARIDFTCSFEGTDGLYGERQGCEYIVVEKGKIRHIDVRGKSD